MLFSTIACPENVYSNRLETDNDDDILQYSARLFRPYYEDYRKWRDNSIDEVKSAHSMRNDSTIISLDIKDYYYNIDMDLDALVADLNRLEIDLKDDNKKIFLNRALSQIHKVFKKKIGATVNLLPIGLVSSGILGNYALLEIDREIMEDINPLYYGRYVDDIIMVIQNLKFQDHEFVEALKELFGKTKKSQLKEARIAKKPTLSSLLILVVILLKWKLKIFDFSKDAPFPVDRVRERNRKILKRGALAC